jgi:hypothetical protein
MNAKGRARPPGAPAHATAGPAVPPYPQGGTCGGLVS